MDISIQSIISIILGSSVLSGIFTGFITWFATRNVEKYKISKQMKTQIYTDLYLTIIKAFFETAREDQRSIEKEKFIQLTKVCHLWASEKVVTRINEFIDAVNIEKNTSQAVIQKGLENLVLALREDISGEQLNRNLIGNLGKIN